ncbi:MAG: Hpt domain-containing protein [Lachnospiraceae bacterium]|nr:Hpt domain-containing protein [Lachnospiraceae bacterium]
MITVEALREYGANTEEALVRCMGNAELYTMLVGESLKDVNYEKLKTAIENKDYDEAFSAAHALKGVLTNLSLTPLAEPVTEIVDSVRAHDDRDYSGLITKIDEELSRLKALA